MDKPLITFVFGTRPEAIKLAPLIQIFRKNNTFKTRVVSTGQHRELLMDVLEIFKIIPDIDLNLMMEKQSLSNLTASILKGLESEFDNFLPNLIFVQGDTTTAYAAAMAAFYKKIKIGHVEAGLRTGDLYSPFPEEANRRLISQISDLHFAPTKKAEKNLLDIKINGKVFFTGNTVIDALLSISNRNDQKMSANNVWINNKFILVTVHRRENWGGNIENICDALKQIADDFPDINFVIPMHPNKIVRETLVTKLQPINLFHLIEPLKYTDLINALKNCFLVLTDSGGIQEEAPTLGKPVLVLRNNTERIEGIENGTAKLVGTEVKSIYEGVSELLLNKSIYQSMSDANNPYGDGKSCQRILDICLDEIFNKYKS